MDRISLGDDLVICNSCKIYIMDEAKAHKMISIDGKKIIVCNTCYNKGMKK